MHDRPTELGTVRAPATPRWVKLFALALAALVLVAAAVAVLGGGEHGPGRHLPAGSAGAVRLV